MAAARTKILVFGNELIAEDSLAPAIARKLEEEMKELGISFIFCSSYDEIALYGDESGAIILDTVEGITAPKLLRAKDLSLTMQKPYSAHDLDLGFFLSLMKPEGVRIVGVPKIKKTRKIGPDGKKPDAKTLAVVKRLLLLAIKKK